MDPLITNRLTIQLNHNKMLRMDIHRDKETAVAQGLFENLA